jgi:hypothetical protein
MGSTVAGMGDGVEVGGVLDKVGDSVAAGVLRAGAALGVGAGGRVAVQAPSSDTRTSSPGQRRQDRPVFLIARL